MIIRKIPVREGGEGGRGKGHGPRSPISRRLVQPSAIKGSSNEKLYQELGLESLQNREWFRKLSVFYKIDKEQPPKYLYDLIPSNKISYQTRIVQIW